MQHTLQHSYAKQWLEYGENSKWHPGSSLVKLVESKLMLHTRTTNIMKEQDVKDSSSSSQGTSCDPVQHSLAPKVVEVELSSRQATSCHVWPPPASIKECTYAQENNGTKAK